MAEPTSLRDDFERWARISARMIALGPVDCARLVREEGVEHEWQAADAHWYGVLLEDLDAGRTERVLRYRALVEEQRDEPEAAPPSEDEIATLNDEAEQPPSGAVPAFAQQLAPEGRQPVRPSEEQTGTSIDVGALRDAAVAKDALSWSLEQYAWLCAELSVYPDRHDELWAARGVHGEGAQQAVQRAWEERLRQSPEEGSEHRSLLERYRQMLASDAAGRTTTSG